MAELKDVIDTLDNAADSFDGIATKEQKKIYDEVVSLAKDLKTKNGKVIQSIENLKLLTKIKAHLAALSKDKEWVAGITQFAQYFGHLQKMQNEYYSQHFTESTLGMDFKKKNELMRKMAVQNTMEALMGDGLKANVTDKLNDILLRAVTSGSKFADLQHELHAHLMGENGGKGAFARYATTYATTALSQFAGQHNKLVTDDLGLEWFMYTGSNKETTREFCEHLTGKKYIHKSEIPTILTGKIDGHQCAIYDKTGLPLGMIAGTTPENFQCNCGGWNCRHQLVPVHELAVPASIRYKFERLKKTKENQQWSEFQNEYKRVIDGVVDNARKSGVDVEVLFKDKTKSKDFYVSSFENIVYEVSVRKDKYNSKYKALVDEYLDATFIKFSATKKLANEINALSYDNIGSTRATYEENLKKIDALFGEINKLKQVHEKNKEEFRSKNNPLRQPNYDLQTPLSKEEIKRGRMTLQDYQRLKLEEEAEKLGIKLERPMTRKDANEHRENPLFGFDDTYSTNCQTCTMVYLARRQGLDVEAISGKTKDGDIWDTLKKNGITFDGFGDTRFLTKGGTRRNYSFIDLNVDSTKNQDKIIEIRKKRLCEKMIEEGLYEIYCVWEGGGGHVYLCEKIGVNYRFYDPQNHKIGKALDTRFGIITIMGVRRIDDMVVNPKCLSLFKVKTTIPK